MKTKTTEIIHPSELNALSSFTIFRRRGLGQLQIASSFEHPDKNQLENDLNKYYYACGCSTSAKLLLIGTFIGILYVALYYASQDLSFGNAILTIISAGIGGAVLGKGIGLFRANLQLKRTVRTIQEHWRPKVKQELEQILCG